MDSKIKFLIVNLQLRIATVLLSLEVMLEIQKLLCSFRREHLSRTEKELGIGLGLAARIFLASRFMHRKSEGQYLQVLWGIQKSLKFYI